MRSPYRVLRRRRAWWPGAARLRLASGLILFAYAATHLANHALGLVSLAAMERGRLVFLAFWRLPPVEGLLLLALLTHVALALHALWRRRTLRLPPLEYLQLALGLLIPAYLVRHILGTGWLHRCCGLEDSYSYMLDLVWPEGGWRQAVMLLIVWTHGCIGVHRWLQLKPAGRRLAAPLLAAATLLPALALAGFLAAGRESLALRSLDPKGWAALGAAQGWPVPQAVRERFAATPEALIVDGFLLLVLALLGLRLLRWLAERRRLVRVTYPGGHVVAAPRGYSVLEASRQAGIAHAAICGGRGRCSTCRVRVTAGLDQLPPPKPAEERVLTRIGAAPDVRLACQVRPTAALTVVPLIAAAASETATLLPADPTHGAERTIAVLFADLRGFTRLAERRLPYDTVFILNRYFGTVGAAVEEAGGRIDKFIGDGVMALFGTDSAPEEAARAALAAARRIGTALVELNRELAPELGAPLQIALGLHLGPVILGEMGYGATSSLTAVGDTVNVASRLETLCKELDLQLVVSQETLRRAGVAGDHGEGRAVTIRGRSEPLLVRLIRRVEVLPEPDLPVPPARARRLALWPAR